jgi:hypothetical protein
MKPADSLIANPPYPGLRIESWDTQIDEGRNYLRFTVPFSGRLSDEPPTIMV